MWTEISRRWLLDVIEFVEELPKASVGKYKKSDLRERFKNYSPTKS